MKGEIYIYFCKYYILVGCGKEKLMKLISNSENKEHGKVGFRLHEKILFRTRRT